MQVMVAARIALDSVVAHNELGICGGLGREDDFLLKHWILRIVSIDKNFTEHHGPKQCLLYFLLLRVVSWRSSLLCLCLRFLVRATNGWMNTTNSRRTTAKRKFLRQRSSTSVHDQAGRLGLSHETAGQWRREVPMLQKKSRTRTTTRLDHSKTNQMPLELKSICFETVDQKPQLKEDERLMTLDNHPNL